MVREERARNALSWINRNCPSVAGMIPENAELFSLEGTGVDGVCTHPNVVTVDLIADPLDFDDTRGIPDGFFLAAIDEHTNTESLVVAWMASGRKFWFRDRYLVVVANTGDSVEKTNTKFAKAVETWEKGESTWTE